MANEPKTIEISNVVAMQEEILRLNTLITFYQNRTLVLSQTVADLKAQLPETETIENNLITEGE